MELVNHYEHFDNGKTVTNKVKIKGTEDELRDLALTVLEAIDDGKSKACIDGVPLVIKLVH